MGALGTTEHHIDIAGKTLRFEGGRLARQAGGAVVASIGDTTILTTTTASREPKDYLGFLPLTIDVEERMYAAGKIPGGFFRREGRPSEDAVLACRLVDRPMRPTFGDDIRNEIQVVNTILQTTQIDPYDVLAINAASVSTLLAGIPFNGPVAGLRYAMLRDGSWVAFPTFQELEDEAVFQMVVAGRVTDSGEVAVLMVEADATEHAWDLVQMGAQRPTEEVIGQALEDAKDLIRQLCEAQRAFVTALGGRPPTDLPRFPAYTAPVFELVENLCGERVRAVYRDHALSQHERGEQLAAIRGEAVEHAVANGPADLDEDARRKQAREAFRSVEKAAVRALVADTGTRIDGRGPRDIRRLEIDVGVLDKTHGSGLFQRGETQVLTVLALGSMRDAQRLDTLAPEEEKRYLHHYNFPPFSTGETGRIGSPRRREIGHGALAERAVLPVVPTEEEFPYAIRLVSEVTSSNGSTSMASVCASTLALMDGGVPIRRPVAGIAMGLIREGDQWVTLTDIMGTEDFFGDMDFKVAGTRDFVTALQLDTKLEGIPADVLQQALVQAREARHEILDRMAEVIAEPRPQVKPSAPQVQVLTIPQDKIGDVIGPRGKVIKEITDDTGAEIDVDEEDGVGVVRIYASNATSAQEAMDRVNAIANPTIPEAGERYHATVVKTVDFGAFVNLTPGVDGLLHISKLSERAGRRLNHGEEAVSVGDKVWVEVKEVLDGGRKFKLDFVDEGDAAPAAPAAAAAPTGDAPNGDDGGDDGEEQARRRSRHRTRDDDGAEERPRARMRTRSRSRE